MERDVSKSPSRSVVLFYPTGGTNDDCFTNSLIGALSWDAAHHAYLADAMGINGLYVDSNRDIGSRRFMRYRLCDSCRNVINQGEILTGRMLHCNWCNKDVPEPLTPDWLWWVDTDISFPRYGILDELLASADPIERPVLSALYFGYMNGKELVPVWYGRDERDGRIEHLHNFKSGLNRLGVCGMGCCLIHRSVFEKFGNKYAKTGFLYFGRDRAPWTVLPDVNNDMTGFGEDNCFPVLEDTPVLGADWSWQPIADYQVGDGILAFDEFSPRYSSRRYQRAIVEQVIHRHLPRVRIVTNEREIITTAEHPWLTKLGLHDDDKRAWLWRPASSLKPGMKLASVMPVEDNPDINSDDYRRGYVQGLLHSDGTRTVVGKNGLRFTVRMKDTLPLERLATILAALGIGSRRMPVSWDKNPNHAPMHGVSIAYQSESCKVDGIWHISELPSRVFAAGYLAGMFDGDGSISSGPITIWSRREAYKDRLEHAARMIGIPFSRRNSTAVHIDNQDERWRFFQATLPALHRRTAPLGQIANSGGRAGAEVYHRSEIIEAIESLVAGPVMCLRTSSSTFIADGLASHNCYRCHEQGIPIYGDANIQVNHMKKRFENFETFLASFGRKETIDSGTRTLTRMRRRFAQEIVGSGVRAMDELDDPGHESSHETGRGLGFRESAATLRDRHIF